MPNRFIFSLTRRHCAAARLLASLTAAAVLTACTVVDTESIRFPYAAGARCDSRLGSYSLPKTVIRVEVMGTDPDPKKALTVLTALDEISIADGDRMYCLDHLASPTAKDDINVVRGMPASLPTPPRLARTSTNLLTFVASNTIDYTADIIRRIVRAIFIGISGKPDFTPVARSLKVADGATYPLADDTFDQFNVADVIRINRTLRPLGYCVLLELGSFDAVAQEGQRFCSDHQYLRQRRERFDEAYLAYDKAVDLPARVPGILYRPRQPFKMFVYAKDDPKGPESWRLVYTTYLKLENISPVISLGVERAIFSARRTAFLFDRGALTGWCVSKKSELLAAVEIPLEMFMVRIDQATKSDELMGAERDLLKLQRQYIQYLADPKATKPTTDAKGGALTGVESPADAVFTPAFQAEGDRQAAVFDEFNPVCAAPAQSPIPGVKS
jgi:hypothetical protein